jgi:hypothetical protein
MALQLPAITIQPIIHPAIDSSVSSFGASSGEVFSVVEAIYGL